MTKVLILGAFLLALGASTSVAAQDAPVQAGVLDQVSDVVQPVTDVVEPVVEPVTTAVEPVVEPVTSAVEPVNNVVEPVAEPVAEVVEPVVAPVTDSVDPVVEPAIEAVEPVAAPVTDVAEPVVAPGVEPVTSAVGPVTDMAEPALGPVTNQADDDSNSAEADRSLTGLSDAVSLTFEGELPLSNATPSTGDAAFRTFMDHASGTVDPSVLDVAVQQLPASIVLDPLLGADGQPGMTADLLAAIRVDRTAGIALEPASTLLSDIGFVDPVADISDQLVESLAIVPGPALTTVRDTTTAVTDTTTTLTPVIDLILRVDVVDPVANVADQVVGSVTVVTGPALATVQGTTTAVIETLRPTLDTLDLAQYLPDPDDRESLAPLPVTDTIDVVEPEVKPVLPIAPLSPKAGPDAGAHVDEVVAKAPVSVPVAAEPARGTKSLAPDANDSLGTTGFGSNQRVLGPDAPTSAIPNLAPAAHQRIAPTSDRDVRTSNRLASSTAIVAAIARNQVGVSAADTLPSSAPAHQRSEPLNLAVTGIPTGASAGHGDSTSAHGESPHGSLGDAASLGTALRQRWLSSSVRIPSSIASYVPVRPG